MIRSMLGFLIMALALGISLAAMPQAANAQTDKENKEKKVEREDDDDDDDENLTDEDRKNVKVSIDEARVIALKRVSGKVVGEELEKENGRLQYAFDIRDNSGKIWDVEIDAMTGDVLQAIEDDVDDDTERGSLGKAKHLVYRAANTVKHVTVKAVDKLF